MILLFKCLTLLLAPLGSALALVGFGLVVMRRRPRLARGLLLLAVAWLWLAATPWFAAGLASTLEGGQVFTPAADHPPAAVIVLLGGAVTAARPPAHPHHDLGASADRIVFAAELWHAGRAPRIIVTGGSLAGEADEASAMRAMLIALGVPAAAISVEPQARTTREHPGHVAALLDDADAPLLLVTSALHMRRAATNFRHHGLTVLPAPTDFEILRSGGLLDYLPQARALERSERVVREWLGLAHAQVTGG